MDINEARKNLEACLTEEQKKEYFAQLRQWFLFSAGVTKEEFDKGVRKLFVSQEQIRCHNHFLLAILTKSSSNSRSKAPRSTNDKGIIESADYADYVQPSSPTTAPRPEFENRTAAGELFIPDSGFIGCRIAITAWENGMEGAEDSVTELMVHACQVFVKNIITAMITRKKGYRVRDGKFQYGFNLPVPNPFIRNFNNIIDDTQESKVEVANGDDTLLPKCKLTLENMEQQVAFSYSCAKRTKFDNSLTVRLLYDTIRENPRILGLHTIQSINVFKLGLFLDEDD